MYFSVSDLHQGKNRQIVARNYYRFDTEGIEPNVQYENAEYLNLRLDLVTLQLLTR